MMARYTEEATLFDCAGSRLVGILARPQAPAETGVVVIVGGPQYRAGSHRQFTLLARRLAETGHSTLRFDYRGMGDSEGEPRDFLNVTEDIAAAIGELQRLVPSVRKVALWGLCDGASAALLYVQTTQDARIRGLHLLNPWVRSAASLATTQVKHYYAQRLRQKEFWIKLASGKVAASAVNELMRAVRTMASGSRSQDDADTQTFQQRMARGWRDARSNIMLVLSGTDYTAKEFLEHAGADDAWKGLLDAAHVTRHDLPQADHTFSNAAARGEVEALTASWLQHNAAH